MKIQLNFRHPIYIRGSKCTLWYPVRVFTGFINKRLDILLLTLYLFILAKLTEILKDSSTDILSVFAIFYKSLGIIPQS